MTLIKVNSRGRTSFGRRNLVINGAMNVAQRGTSASVTDGTNEGYSTLDRFRFDYANNAGGTATISQDTTVPSGYGFSNSFKVDVTGADTSIADTHMIVITTKLEAQDVRNSGWDYTNSSSKITLSFWARSVKAGIYNVVLKALDAGDIYYPIEYTLVANTWKKVEVSIPGDSSLVFDDNNDVGLELRWNLQLGDLRNNGTANQWNSDSTQNAGTSNQVNFFDDAANNFFLTGVQLEVGDEATDFEHRSFGEELSLCQRYFQSWGAIQAVGSGTWYNASQVIAYMPFHKIMRAVPTMTTSGNNFAKVYLGGSTTKPVDDSTPFDLIKTTGCRMNLGVSSNGTSGHGAMVQTEGSGKYIHADADL
tara:strand:+ start:204 stop:1295 length:1092 start_codon:yes stop_codon:yes gene_type:complete